MITWKKKEKKSEILNILCWTQAPQRELISKYTRDVATRGSPLAVDGAAWGSVGGVHGVRVVGARERWWGRQARSTSHKLKVRFSE